MKQKKILLLMSISVLSLAGWAATGPNAANVKIITSFENGSPFTTGEIIREFTFDRVWPITPGTVVRDYATDGSHALMAVDTALVLNGPLDWTGYDDLKIDVFNASDEYQRFEIEIQDNQTKSYWEQVLCITAVEPGASTVQLSLNALSMGGKSRPGRLCDVANIRRMVIKVYNTDPKKPLYLDHIRLEKDLERLWSVEPEILRTQGDGRFPA